MTSWATNIDLEAPECGVGLYAGTVESGHPNLPPMTERLPKLTYYG